MNTWDKVISAYLDSMAAGGRCAGTIRLHAYYLAHFRTTAPCPAKVSRAALEHFLATHTWAPETRRSARAVANGFFTYAHDAGITATNPAKSLPSIRVPAGIPRPAKDQTIRQALTAADARVGLMIRLGAYAGLRCSEIAAVSTEAWDGQALAVIGKGGRGRLVPIIDRTLKRRLEGTPGYLFPGKTEGHLSAGHVCKLLSRALPEGVTGHQLRHRFATVAYQGTRDLLAVGQVLGHSKPETTKRYCQVPADALLAVVQAAAS